MSERETVQSKIGRSARTLLDERVDQYSSPEGPKRTSSTLKSASHPGRALTVSEVGALSDFDDVAVRIADVAADLAVLGYRLRDELGSSTFP